MRIKRRSHATWPAIVTGSLTLISLVWKAFEAWSNIEFIKGKSGLLWGVVRFLFFSSTGANIVLVIFAALFIFVLLFDFGTSKKPSRRFASTPAEAAEEEFRSAPKARPTIEFMQSKTPNVWVDEDGQICGPPEDNSLPIAAVTAEFRRNPDDAEIGFIDIRASIKFCSKQQDKILVNDALWDGRCQGSQYCTFEIGDSAAVIIALFDDDRAITYEGRHVHDELIPDGQPLTQDSYDVDVELIGTKVNKVLVHETFSFTLTLRPEPSLRRRGLHAEIGVVATRGPIESPIDSKERVFIGPSANTQLPSIEDKSK